MKVDSIITVAKGELSRKQWEKLFAKLTFFDADENEVTSFQYVSGRDVVLLPRGTWNLLPKDIHVTDLRSKPKMPRIEFVQKLDAPGYEGQADAVKAMYEHEQGQVIAPPGVGKTQIGMAFAASCQTRTLIVVHTQDLLKQWKDRAALVCPDMKVGTVQGQTNDVEHLTIATAQTLKRHLGKGGKFWRQFGCIIVDEAHHAAAETWEWLLNVCPAYYRFGVTASEKRSDGRQRLVKHNIGPVIYKVKFKSQVPMIVVPVKSGFKSKWNGQQYNRIIREVIRDPGRNKLIAKIVAREIVEGNSILVLSRQIEHLERMRDAILIELALTVGVSADTSLEVVTGRVPRIKRDKMIGALRDGSLRCILGTQLFEEGVDIPRINRIILSFPGTEITALQKIGRGSRKAEGKYECIVYDILDDFVRVLAKQYLRRRSWYKSVGIKVEKARKYGQKGRIKGKRKNALGRSEAEEKRNGRRIFQVARPRR